MLKITIVVGNPKPRSRTRRIAELTVARMFGAATSDLQVIDLADHVAELFTWPSEEMAGLNARVAESDFIVLASPTYKATYTGLLKAFLDRYPANGLKGVTAICLMTGAGLSHSMAPTVHLVPLLLELGATVPIKGLYFIIGEMDQIEEVVNAAAEEAVTALKSLYPIIRALGGKPAASAMTEPR